LTCGHLIIGKKKAKALSCKWESAFWENYPEQLQIRQILDQVDIRRKGDRAGIDTGMILATYSNRKAAICQFPKIKVFLPFLIPTLAASLILLP
jgi:hypothetical protein